MENRRPIRVQKKEDILRIKEQKEEPLHNAAESSENASDISADSETDSDETLQSENVSTAAGVRAKNKKEKAPFRRYISFYWSLASCIVIGYLLYRINNKCTTNIQVIENRNKMLSQKVEELEAFLHSKHKEVDVADYLEGARIIHDLTTESFSTRDWFKPIKGLSAEVAIDRVCTKHHCYSFKGSEGKLAIAFKNEKIIRKIGILHPLYDNRSSAIKKFTVDCIVNNNHVRVGSFEYEIPGDSFQQFSITPTQCTGIVFRIQSNHGNKLYTCIYKVYAFE